MSEVYLELEEYRAKECDIPSEAPCKYGRFLLGDLSGSWVLAVVPRGDTLYSEQMWAGF